jgi:hypothetical protein
LLLLVAVVVLLVHNQVLDIILVEAAALADLEQMYLVTRKRVQHFQFLLVLTLLLLELVVLDLVGQVLGMDLLVVHQRSDQYQQLAVAVAASIIIMADQVDQAVEVGEIVAVVEVVMLDLILRQRDLVEEVILLAALVVAVVLLHLVLLLQALEMEEVGLDLKYPSLALQHIMQVVEEEILTSPILMDIQEELAVVEKEKTQ